MAKDKHDKSTKSIIPRGRPPVGDQPMSSSDRMRLMRKRRKDQGWRQLWLCPKEQIALNHFRDDPTLLDHFIDSVTVIDQLRRGRSYNIARLSHG